MRSSVNWRYLHPDTGLKCSTLFRLGRTAGTETVRSLFFLAEQLWGEEASTEYFLLLLWPIRVSGKPEPLSVLQTAALYVCLPCLVTFSE